MCLCLFNLGRCQDAFRSWVGAHYLCAVCAYLFTIHMLFLDTYNTCVTWTHAPPLQLPTGAVVCISLWSGWEMSMVILNFSAGRCCNSVSSSEPIGQDAPKCTFQWCRGPSGEHISKCQMSTSEDLSARYQMLLLLLELLWTEKETHHIALNKAEGSNFAWNVNSKYVKKKSTDFCLSNVN